MSHNWSGWPGAWCLDCGEEDPNEICMADCPHNPYNGDDQPPGPPCPIHIGTKCQEPGSNRYNPYIRKDNA